MSPMRCISGMVVWEGGRPSPSIAARMAGAAGPAMNPGSVRTVECEGAILTESFVPRAAMKRGASGRHEDSDGRRRPDPERRADSSVFVVADARIDEVDGTAPTRAARSDPHILLSEAYARWGSGFVDRLVGDYAFALWDAAARRLFAARDPMGMRPFYYARRGGRLLFGSRIEQILTGGIQPALFEPAVATYLVGPWGRPDWTFFTGIEQLPPGRVLIADADGVRLIDGPSVVPPGTRSRGDDSEHERNFRDLFLRVVEDRLPSGGRTGLFLSGGTDSGAMASAAGWLREKGRYEGRLTSYSFSFLRFSDCDERRASHPITERYGFRSRDVPGDDAWPLSRLEDQSTDLADPYFSPHQRLFEAGVELAAEDGTDVMMMGNRGDEMVGDAITDLPGMVRSFRLLSLIRELRALGGRTPRGYFDAVRRRLVRPWRMERNAIGNPSGYTPPIPPWIPEDFARRVALEDILRDEWGEWTFRQTARERRYRRIVVRGSQRITEWLTRLHRRSGIEFVDPWSDVRIARFVLSIPQHLVNRAADPKRIVGRALQGIYPEAALSAAGKVIPSSLFDFGIEHGSRDTIEDLLHDSVAEAWGFLDASEVRKAWKTYVHSGRAPYDFWWPLTLELWLRRHWS